MTSLALLLLAQIQFTPVPLEPPFVLNHNPTPSRFMVETMAGGLAIFDYNNDGRPDLFFTNGAALPGFSPKHSNRLYRNDRNWKFTDVTSEAGLAGAGYSTGAAAADFDDDGNVDLFVAGLYSNHLYRNLGNGKFEELTDTGILSNEWSVAAGWFDFDQDGRLDLLVANYGTIDLKEPRYCGDKAKDLRVYCHPRYFEPRPNQLYRNLGNGKFLDVSKSSGIGIHRGRGMSVAFADYDADGRIDAFVTNDNMPNFLFRNLGNGRFDEVALLAGVALLDSGKPVASMGTEFRDVDGDGRPDVVFTALTGETYPYFRNIGNGQFVDATASSQLARLTNKIAGWGIGLIDFDNDGFKDIFTANSHVNHLAEQFEATTYRQANTVFHNNGKGQFQLVRDSGLEKSIHAHRGAAFADLDGDGRVDAVTTALGEPATLWRNTTPGDNHYLRIELRGKLQNRTAIGATVRVGDRVDHISTSAGYASSVVGPLHFGLGALKTVPRVEIRWPSGQLQIIRNVDANQTLRIEEP